MGASTARCGESAQAGNGDSRWEAIVKWELFARKEHCFAPRKQNTLKLCSTLVSWKRVRNSEWNPMLLQKNQLLRKEGATGRHAQTGVTGRQILVAVQIVRSR